MNISPFFSIILRLSHIIPCQFGWLEIKPYSSLPLLSWNAIMGWLKRTVSSRMFSKNDVGCQIWCKLSGFKTKFCLEHWNYCKRFWNVAQKRDFIKMIVFLWAIQSTLKTNARKSCKSLNKFSWFSGTGIQLGSKAQEISSSRNSPTLLLNISWI